MAKDWHYNHDGRQPGPVSISKLRALVIDGTIHPQTFVWKIGTKDWVRAWEVDGLFPDIPPFGSNDTILDGRNDVPEYASYGRTHIHIQRIAIMVAALVGVLSPFLPWVNMPLYGTIYGLSLIHI